MILLPNQKQRIIKLQQGGKTSTNSIDQISPYVDINITTAAPKLGNIASAGAIKFRPITLKPNTYSKEDKELKGAKGFISDRQYAIDELASIRNRISHNMATNPNYVSSGDRANDLMDLKIATNNLYNSGQLEKDFNKSINQKKIDKGSLMIYNGKALAYNLETKQLGFVSEDNIFDLTNTGKRKYKVASVGDALRYRKNYKEFSGYTNSGKLLTGMLMHTLDSGELFKRIDNTFKAGGFTAGSGFELITPTNATANAKEVLDILHSSNKTEILKKSTTSNAAAIRAMRHLINAQLNSDMDFKSSLRTKAIQIAESTIPGFYHKSESDREADIDNIKQNIIDNEAIKYIKSKYSEAFKALAENAVKNAEDKTKVPQNAVQEALSYKGERTNVEFKSIVDGKSFMVHPYYTVLPESVTLLHKMYDSNNKLELSNLSSLDKLGGSNLRQSIITKGNKALASLTVNGLDDVVADPTSGVRVLKGMPMIKNEDGTEVVSKEAIHLQEAVELARDMDVKNAWTLVCSRSKTLCEKYKEHNLANLNHIKNSDGTSIAEVVSKKLSVSKPAVALFNYIHSAGVKYKSLVEFSVFVKLYNGPLNFIESSTHPDAIPEEDQKYYTEVDDENFENHSAKTNKSTSGYNVYRTTVYMPISNYEVLSDLEIPTRNYNAQTSHRIAKGHAVKEHNQVPTTVLELLQTIGQ